MSKPLRYPANEAGSQVQPNSLHPDYWTPAIVLVLLTEAFAISTMSLAAASFAHYNSVKKNIEKASNGDIVVAAPELLASGIVILVLSIVLILVLLWIAIHQFTHRPGSPAKPIQRGFHSVPSFYWSLGITLMILIWLLFGAAVAFSNFFRIESLHVFGRLPNGLLINPNIGQSLPELTRYANFHKWGLLRALDALTWGTFLFGLIAASVLLCAAGDQGELTTRYTETPTRRSGKSTASEGGATEVTINQERLGPFASEDVIGQRFPPAAAPTALNDPAKAA